MMKTETHGSAGETAGDTFRDYYSHATGTRPPRVGPLDRALAANATHALSWLMSVPGVSLCIAVDDHQVTLSGQVDWDYQRSAAVRAILQLRHVSGVNDRITLKPRIASPIAFHPSQPS